MCCFWLANSVNSPRGSAPRGPRQESANTDTHGDCRGGHDRNCRGRIIPGGGGGRCRYDGHCGREFVHGLWTRAILEKETDQFEHRRNLLRQVWEGPEHSKLFPSSVWKYLATASENTPTLRESLVTEWRQDSSLACLALRPNGSASRSAVSPLGKPVMTGKSHPWPDQRSNDFLRGFQRTRSFSPSQACSRISPRKCYIRYSLFF